MMQALVSNFRQPLARLAVHVVQIGELPQRPEILAGVSNPAAFYLSFFPATGWVAGLGHEIVFARESQETGMEAHQVAIVLGHGTGEIVIENFSAHAVEGGEGVAVTTHKGFKTLAMSELQIQHPAVRVDQSEGIQLAFVTLVVERAEVTPVYFEAFAG